MKLTLDERQALIKMLSRKYYFGSKKQKGFIIDELVELSGFNRSYATRTLRSISHKPKTKTKRKSGRYTYYDDKVRKVLEKIWEVMDYLCGTRLAPIIPEIISKLEAFGEIQIPDETRDKLIGISASTIDRLLRPAKKKIGRKVSSTTKQGKYLIDQIPVKTFAEWDNTYPGYAQIDLVAHIHLTMYGPNGLLVNPETFDWSQISDE